MRGKAATFTMALMLAARLVHADPSPSELQAARDLFSKAEKDEDAGNWSEALDKLKRAVSVKPTPGLRYHIALCEEKLGQLVAALADYTAADQAAREANNKDVIDAVAEPLKTLRIRVPTLTIEVPAASGAQVDLDGKTVAPGLYGVAMPVEPGMHRVQAKATGKRPFTTQVQLREREATTSTVRWVDIPVVNDDTQPSHDTPDVHPPESSTSGGVKVGAIVMTVIAAGALGFGIGAYMAADGAQTNLQQMCPTMTDCGDLKTTVRTWDAVALTSWIAAAAFTTIAIVLWATPSHSSSSSARIEARPGGLAFTGTF